MDRVLEGCVCGSIKNSCQRFVARTFAKRGQHGVNWSVEGSSQAALNGPLGRVLRCKREGWGKTGMRMKIADMSQSRLSETRDRLSVCLQRTRRAELSSELAAGAGIWPHLLLHRYEHSIKG